MSPVRASGSTKSPAFAFANLPFWLLLAMPLALLLVLGSFPNQDGPIRLYYADIYRSLLAGSGTYSAYFKIKHILPPYMLADYLLIGLMSFLPPLLAERIFLCLYTIVMALGFRSLLRALNTGSGALAVCIIPFVLHKFIYLGFYQFSLGVALALIACGEYLRDPEGVRGWRRVRFLALLAVIMLSHPIPLFAVLLVIGTYILISICETAKRLDGTWRRRIREAGRAHSNLLVTAAFSCCIPLYVLKFVQKGGERTETASSGVLLKLGKLALFGPISPFQVWYYALPLGLLVLMVGVSWAICFWRRKAVLSKPRMTLFAVAAVCVIIYVVAPDQLNGSWGFDQRFPLFALLLTMAAMASEGALQHGRYRNVIVVAAIIVGIGTFAYQARISSRLQGASSLYQLPRVQPGSLGVIIRMLPPRTGLGFSPYEHIAAYYFEASHAILMNAPWLELGISPIEYKDSFKPVVPVGAPGESVANYSPVPDFVLVVGPSASIESSPTAAQLAAYGYRKEWGTDIVSVFRRGPRSLGYNSPL